MKKYSLTTKLQLTAR